MLVATETITVFHKVYDPKTRLDRWQTFYLTEASWYGKQAASVGTGGLNTASLYTVRAQTCKKIAVSVGDIVVRGVMNVPYSGEACLKNREHFTVTAVRDNRRGNRLLRHWKIEGE